MQAESATSEQRAGMLMMLAPLEAFSPLLLVDVTAKAQKALAEVFVDGGALAPVVAGGAACRQCACAHGRWGRWAQGCPHAAQKHVEQTPFLVLPGFAVGLPGFL